MYNIYSVPEGKNLFYGKYRKGIEGREPEFGEDIERIGTLAGRIHGIMQRYEGRLTVHDKHFFIDRYIDILIQKKVPNERET